MPKNFRHYKLLVIAGLPNNYDKPTLIIIILLKYQDNECYNKIFNYLVENFNFLPEIIHTDFEKSFYLVINNNKYFKDKIIHSKCIFHFSQMIKKKLSNN